MKQELKERIIIMLEDYMDCIHEEADLNNHASDTTKIKETIKELEELNDY